MSQRQIASCELENLSQNLCRCNRICRSNKSHRFSLIWFFATCCSDKILPRRQRFSQKFSSTHEAICRCDVSPHLVAATSRPTCTHGVICRRDVLQRHVASCVPTLNLNGYSKGVDYSHDSGGTNYGKFINAELALYHRRTCNLYPFHIARWFAPITF